MMLARNSALCGECYEEVESRHRHDIVTCSCGNISVDGGLAYRRRSFRTENWTDTSIGSDE